MELFLAEYEREDPSPLAEALTGITESGAPLADGVKRTVTSLRVLPPPGLVVAFRAAPPSDQAAIHPASTQGQAYRAFGRRFDQALRH
ncbi:hypothetical protein ACWD4N_45440 [Streptomyces sp. NPDC002586]